MGRIFWIITAAFIAVATHISYVLFEPGLIFQKKLYAASGGKAANSFFILKPDEQSQLFPSATAHDVVGVCKYDLDSGHVVFSAQLPASYWTLSIYTDTGTQIYALDDVQAGSNKFTIDLTRAKSMLQQLFAKNDGEDGGQIENLGWKVETTQRRGLAVVWVPLSDAMMRGATEEIIKGSHCEAKALEQ
jgi:uncharacterized membrane protein